MKKFFKGMLLLCGLCLCITVGARGIDIHEVAGQFDKTDTMKAINGSIEKKFNAVVNEANHTLEILSGTDKLFSLSYVDNEYMLYEDNTTVITEDLAFSSDLFIKDILLGNLVETLFDVTDHHDKTISDNMNATFEDEAAYSSYGVLLNAESYSYKRGNESVSGDYIRKLKLALISDLIDNFIDVYGADRSAEDGPIEVPSGLRPTVTAEEIQDTSVSLFSEMKAPVEGNSTSEEGTDFMCKIYRSTKKDSGFEPITEWEVSCDGIGYTDDNLKPATTYYYKSQVVGGDDTNVSDVLTVTTKESLGEGVTVNLSVSKGGKNSLELSWDNKGDGVTYTVYRTSKKKHKASDFKKIATTKDTFYVDSKLTYGTKYYYKLVVDNGTKKLTTEEVEAKAIPNFVDGIEVTATSNSTAKVAWNKTADAAGYRVRVSADGDKWKEYSVIKGGKKTSYTVSGLKANTNYYVQVKAFAKVKGKVKWGEYGYFEEVTTGPAVPSVTLKSFDAYTINISNKAVTNAKTYEVQRSTNKKKGWKTVSKSSELSFNDSGLKFNKKYYYRVRSCNDTICSKWSSVKSAKTTLTKPSLDFSYDDNGKPVVLVNGVVGATKYEIQRSTNPKKGFKKLVVTKNTSYVDTKAASGKTYYYKVRAINGKKKSGWSTVNSAAAK